MYTYVHLHVCRRYYMYTNMKMYIITYFYYKAAALGLCLHYVHIIIGAGCTIAHRYLYMYHNTKISILV